MCELDDDLEEKYVYALHALLGLFVSASLDDGPLPNLKASLDAIYAMRGQVEPFADSLWPDRSAPP